MQEMSLWRGIVQIVAAKDELENLQQLSNMQPPMTTTPSSSGPSDSSNLSTIGMIKKISFHLIYDKYVYI